MAKKVKTIFIHIGYHKTGTTALQNFLFHNANNLKIQRYYYPKIGITQNKAHSLLPGIMLLNTYAPCVPVWLQRFIEKNNYANKDIALWQKIINKFIKSKNDFLIISSEEFSKFADNSKTEINISIIASLLKDFNVKIVCYLREPKEYFESLYNQSIKGSNRSDIAEFIKKKIDTGETNYIKALELWENHFGRENIILKLYSKEKLPHGIIPDFCNIVGLKIKPKFIFPNQSNPRLPNGYLELKRQCNIILAETTASMDKKIEINQRIKKILSTMGEKFNPPHCSIFSKKELAHLDAFFKPILVQLKNKYFPLYSTSLFNHNNKKNEYLYSLTIGEIQFFKNEINLLQTQYHEFKEKQIFKKIMNLEVLKSKKMKLKNILNMEVLKSKKMKLILHIGMPKTGSTYIQKQLKNNKNKLAEQGFIYPESVLWKTLPHFELAYPLLKEAGIYEGDSDPVYSHLTEYYLDQYISQTSRNEHTMIISDETLFVCPVRQKMGISRKEIIFSNKTLYDNKEEYYEEKNKFIQTLKNNLLERFDNITIILFIRDQKDFFTSFYKEDVKGLGFIISQDLYNYYNDDMDYKRNIDLWCNIFGKQNIQILPYTKTTINEGILKLFCNKTGIDFNLLDIDNKRENLTLTNDLLNMKKIFNNYLFDFKIHQEFYEYFQEFNAMEHLNTSDSFDKSKKIKKDDNFFNMYTAGNEAIENEFSIEFIKNEMATFTETDRENVFNKFENRLFAYLLSALNSQLQKSVQNTNIKDQEYNTRLEELTSRCEELKSRCEELNSQLQGMNMQLNDSNYEIAYLNKKLIEYNHLIKTINIKTILINSIKIARKKIKGFFKI